MHTRIIALPGILLAVALGLGACHRASPTGTQPPAGSGSGSARATTATFTATVLSATIAEDCPDPAAAAPVAAPGAAASATKAERSLSADEAASGESLMDRARRTCEQTEVQLKLDLHGAPTAMVRLRTVEIVDAKGVVATVTPRAPRRWDATSSAYVAWDGAIVDGTSLTVGYRLSAPSSSGAGSYQVRVIAEAVLADGTVVASDVTKLIDVPLSPMVMT